MPGKNGKRFTIGFQINSLQGRYGSLCWPGIADLAQERDFNLVTFPGEAFNSPYGFEYQYSVIYEFIRAHNLDALVIASGTLYNYVDKAEIRRHHARYAGLPLVSMGIQVEGVPSVLVDNKTGMREAVGHLIEEHNIRRIAFLRGPANNEEAEARFQAYLETLQEHNIKPDPSLILQGDFSPFSGVRAAQEVIRRKSAFDAVVSANDDMAIGLLETFSREGVHVPRDIKVVGFDNLEEVQYNVTPLTTVKQPLYKQARKAAEIALDILENKPVPETVVLPTRLVVRSSCGCFSRSIILLESDAQVFINAADQNKETKEKIKKKIISEYPELDEESFQLQERISGLVREFSALFKDNTVTDEIFHAFLRKMNESLYAALKTGEDIGLWQNVLTLVRNYMLVFLDKQSIPFAEELFQEARIIVGEMMQLQQAVFRLNRGQTISTLISVTQKLITTLSIDELMTIIAEDVPKLGIRSCFIALYDREHPRKRSDPDWQLPEYAELSLAYNERGRVRLDPSFASFPTLQMLPDGMLPEDRRFTFIVLPLFFREDQLGFLIIETSLGEGIVFENLRLQISSAIKGSLLFRLRQKAEQDLTDANNKLLFTNEKLKDLDHAKTNFFANISHELRTPLTLILGPVESIIAGEYGESLSNRDEIFRSIRNNGTRLLKLINNLLDFSKIEAGKMQLRRKRTNISELLSFYTSTIQSAVQSRGLNIIYVDNPEPVIAWVDRDLLENTVFNLLSNSLKFTPVGGTITIQLDRTAEDFTISVSDTGVGIPEEKLQKIFERFSQLDTAPSRKAQGTGIGLAFTKEIVELHGGAITVESRQGKGTTFTMRFPVGGDAPPQAARDESDTADGVQEVKAYNLADFSGNAAGVSGAEDQPAPTVPVLRDKILVVDDNVDMRNFLRSILKNEYTVISAENGKEGLEKAVEYRPDLIISDVMMPEMDGYELTRLIKTIEDLKGIPVILLTAKADVSMKIAGLEYGADDYLAKPFNSKELRARIRSSLEMKKERDGLMSDRKELSIRRDQLEILVSEQTKEIEAEKNHAIMLQKKAEQQLEDFLMVLASAIESKDQYTGGHVERVANYSRDIARRLRMPEEQIRDIYLGAIVHDVGKIGVKDAVLNKPDRLNPQEMANMQLHPVIGKKLLTKIQDIDIAVTIAYSHQERWDGKGYPQGLKGEDIPMPARIVTIADYWDAIITDRPYRKAMHIRKALELMKSERGRAFDPYLYDIFMNEQEKIYLTYVNPEKLREMDEPLPE